MLDIQDGLTILVDKPYQWTSFDVVNKIRWNLKKKLGVKNVKVGHAGTLDPLATGLLVLCLGKHTKLIEGLTNDTKTYTGTFLVGKTTPSFDLETEYNQDFETAHIDAALLESVRAYWQELPAAEKEAFRFLTRLLWRLASMPRKNICFL